MSIVINRLKELDLTEATKFVLPMLYTKDRNDEFFITKYFENCYIGDSNREEQGHRIFLLNTYKLDVSYIKFEKALELIPEYSDDYDYSAKNQVMFVFDVPTEWKKDFELFKTGQFHKFSDKYKTQILKFWGIDQEEYSSVHEILYPKIEPETTNIDLSKEIYQD